MKSKLSLSGLAPHSRVVSPAYSEVPGSTPIPKYEMPAKGVPPTIAYRVVHDELMLDGNPRLNLATFVTTWMEPEATALMTEAYDRNLVDQDEYPQTAELEHRCVNILSRLWNSPDHEIAAGASTVGSSEAAMLAGLALKFAWRDSMRRQSRPTDRPNLVMGINVQVCWEKFCRYWDVEPRFVPMDGDRFHIDPVEAANLCDENTIGVVAIMGSTYDGSYEPVADVCAALDRLHDDGGPDVPVHVDAASGGFVAPFLDPELEWDFRLPRVRSINASGHKYGLVYPGVGWILWRDRAALPEALIFYTNYLGGEEPTLALNFSRPGNQVIGQYYNFLRLGREGYVGVHAQCRDTAQHLAGQISKMGPFNLITDGSELPVFAFALKDEIEGYTAFDVSERLRERGWQVPAYTFPDNRTDLTALRIVVKQGFSMDMADMLLSDLALKVKDLEKRGGGAPARSCFHH